MVGPEEDQHQGLETYIKKTANDLSESFVVLHADDAKNKVSSGPSFDAGGEK